MNHQWNRGLDSQVAAVGVHTDVVSEAFGVTADAEPVIDLIEVPHAQSEFRLTIPLESRARYDVEYAVGAVAEFGTVSPAADFQIIDVFGIELRP